ncbi:hypothetical protein LTR53_016867 [Teratosphaeriaceae sp. CCFEE 6253]|nr:hypothetical protein LTR53_016867 [Teratosphaeriaceae sp. CCFEE 6253]
MVHTVGIVGLTGNVGLPTTKALIRAADAGTIHLIVFHRADTDLSILPKAGSGNVEFRVLSFEDPAEKIGEAVRGVNVFISAVGFGALPHEANLVEGLSKSKDLVTFIPSTFSTTWSEADFQDPRLGPVLKFLHGGWDKAKELGVPVTPVYTGVFDLYWFQIGFIGAPLKGNTIWANAKQLQNRFPITTLDHLGAALARIACSPPPSIANRPHSVVTFWPTGAELADLYTRIHGSPVAVKDFTPADLEAQMDDAANFGPAKAGYWARWESGVWGYEGEGVVVDKGYGGPGLEEVARGFA